MFPCPSCGGKVVYDIEQRALRCEYCSSLFQVSEYREKSEAVSQGTYETQVFVCQNCGAEISAPEEQMMSFCSYCGSEAMLPGRLSQENRPRRVMPFRVSKRACKEMYKKQVSKVLFLPNELKDERFLEQFRGIYIPYYSMDVKFDPGAKLYASHKFDLSGNRYQINTYEYRVDAENNGSRFLRDGSSALDDTIAREIGTYSENDEPFHPGYLAGFYADRADVQPQKYIEDVQSEAAKEAVDTFEKDLRGRQMSYASVGRFGKFITEDDRINAFQAKAQGYFTKLLPVWFLTWRNKDRVSYIVMNGENGKMYADYPASKQQYLLATAVLAVALFALFSLLFSWTAIRTLSVTALLGAVLMVVLSSELRRLMQQELHVFDIGHKGWSKELFAMHGGKARPKRTGKIDSSKVISVILFAVAFFASGAGREMLSLFDGGVSPYSFLTVASVVAVGIGLFCAISSMKSIRYLQERASLISLPWVGFLPLVAVFFVAMWRPVSDYYYYGACILCLLGSLIPSLQLIRIYNLMATRPLPSFYERQGGNHRAS